MTDAATPSFEALIEGLNLMETEGGREFLARLFRQRLERQDYTRYINDDLAGDFACALAQYLAPVIQAAEKVEGMVPAPFKLGNSYSTLDGKLVRFVKIHNEGQNHETMEDESGVNRYTQRDLGRVTGSDHHTPDPRNVLPIYHAPSKGSRGVMTELQLKMALQDIESLKAQLAFARSRVETA